MSDSTQFNLGDILAVDAEVMRSTGAPGFGVTERGFHAKPFARVLAENLALARTLFGDEFDLTSGAAGRKILELVSLGQARSWAMAAAVYDSMFVTSAKGEALSRLGEELGLPRPFLEARGRIKLVPTGDMPAGITITIGRGARLATAGGHHVVLEEAMRLDSTTPAREVAVSAFYPGPSHNLDPNVDAGGGSFPQRIDRWNTQSDEARALVDAENAASAFFLKIEHTQPLTGGERQWPDERYRQLLLRAPRSVWTVEAIQVAVSLVPGVRQVQVFDGRGGLDLNQSIFGNFNFIERVFASERDLGNPYYFTVLVAPTIAAIWDGPTGLRVAVESVIEDLRPIGIFPVVERAVEIGIGIEAKLVVKGVPLPSGTKDTINASSAAKALRMRIRTRLQSYIDEIPFGEPVRASEVMWTIMNEPGVADVRDLKLVKYPATMADQNFANPATVPQLARFACGANVDLLANQIPVFVDRDDPKALEII